MGNVMDAGTVRNYMPESVMDTKKVRNYMEGVMKTWKNYMSRIADYVKYDLKETANNICATATAILVFVTPPVLGYMARDEISDFFKSARSNIATASENSLVKAIISADPETIAKLQETYHAALNGNQQAQKDIEHLVSIAERYKRQFPQNY